MFLKNRKSKIFLFTEGTAPICDFAMSTKKPMGFKTTMSLMFWPAGALFLGWYRPILTKLKKKNGNGECKLIYRACKITEGALPVPTT